MLKFFKRFMIILFSLIGLLVLGIAIFIYTAPQFGQTPEGDDLNRIQESEHYKEGVFDNLIETKMDIPMSKIPGMMAGFLFPSKGKHPTDSLPAKFDFEHPNLQDSVTHVTWFGHSAVMLEIDEKVILIDPMLGPAASPVSFMTNRFNYKQPIRIDDLPHIDAIIISHDHYDHLDYPSILELKDKTDHFFTALGVGSHLKKWGIEADRITELDWWEYADFKGLTFTAAPARHFSGRGITDRNKTQWASWAIKGHNQNIYFSGDGGYGTHFKEIGEKLGPFDFAMMECGQYNDMWAAIHMMPEQTVQAGMDVKGKVLMPIHWGAFDLSLHTWNDPVERFTAAAITNNVDYVCPTIGQHILVGKRVINEVWWK